MGDIEFGTQIGMWALGCIAMELLSGEMLFQSAESLDDLALQMFGVVGGGGLGERLIALPRAALARGGAVTSNPCP